MKKTSLILLGFYLLIRIGFSQNINQIETDNAAFQNPPQSSKVHTWWHWMQGSISKDGITKDLESMKAQGIVEATILNIGLIDNKKYFVPQIKFRTEEWYNMFKWALTEAKRLGITIGAHNCDGWSSSGGPWITPEKSMKMFTWANTNIKGGKTVSIQLERPFSKDNFYKDVAVVAFPSSTEINSFQKAKPTILLNDSTNASLLADGNPISSVKLDRGNVITFQFATEFEATKICLLPRKEFTWSSPKDFEMSYELSSSSNGKDFQQLLEFKVKGLNEIKQIEIPATKSRYYKLAIKDFGYTDSWLALTMAEVELLKKNEFPSYNPNIQFHQEKTVMVKAGDKKSFENTGLSKGGVIQSEVVDISNKMDTNGMLHWNAPAGNWKIIRFGYTTTGAINAPATKEGEGLECDKMDSSMVEFHFSQFPQKLIDKAGDMAGNTFKFLLIDSWECAFQNWTQSFPHEFETRRGYKITPFIPALCGEMVTDAATSEAFLFDFRNTIADLIEHNYYKKFNSLCHKNKLEMHAEVIYGGSGYPPLDVLKTNQYADMPMFEFWTGHNGKTTTLEYNASKNVSLEFLASATLFNNKKVLGSEAYTGSAHYSESPAELKPYGDRAYCSGINQMILHSYVHQPTDSVPGMTLGGFASHFNRNNSWFNFAGSWMDYQSRIQYMLQQGQMQADVLYYVGDQLPQYLEAGKAVNVPNGYQIHVANFDILKNKTAMKNGKLTFGNVVFSLLTLPENMGMELATLVRLEELVKVGLVVYGPKPTKLLSMYGIKNNAFRFNQLIDNIWGKLDGVSVKESSYGRGKIYWGEPMKTVLDKIKLKPDFETLSTDTATFLYTHRALGNKDIYFVYNQQNKENIRDLYFRSVNTSVKEYNPMDGTITPIAFTKTLDGRTKIPFTFGAGESRIFVFEKGEGKPIKSNMGSKEVIEIVDFKGTISFDTRGYGKIEPINITRLQSLTDFENKDIKYFSGFAKYNINFKAPAPFVKSKGKLLLDMGRIGVTAIVTLNGSLLGTVWYSNTQFDVSGLLKEENKLEVIVGNEHRNRIIGDFIEFGKLKNIWTTSPVQNYLDKDKPLKPSGLIGPIKLLMFSN